MSGARHKQDNSKKAESPRRKLYEYRVSRKTNTPKLFQSGAWTINIREFLSLSIGTAHFFANIQTHTDLLNHCGFLHTHNTPTTMTWQGLHWAGAYIYSTAIYPWALTAHRLCHCGVAGAPLPVCLSICHSVHLPVRVADRTMILDHSLKRSQRRCEVTGEAGTYSRCSLAKAVSNVLKKTLRSTAVANGWLKFIINMLLFS